MKTTLLLLFLMVPAYAQEPVSDEHVREIMQQALDNALHDQIKALFITWLRDNTGQPQRAAIGVRKAVRAYRHAMKAIETEQLTRRINNEDRHFFWTRQVRQGGFRVHR